MTIQQISASEAMDLRMRILRPGQPVSTVTYAEDNLPTTFHLGIYLDDKIVCNGTFMQNDSPLFTSVTGAFRLRGMATDTGYQGQNLGSLLIRKAEKILCEKKCPLIWFNARTSAQNFYLKNGYQATGEVFDIPGGGPHVVMYKLL